MPLLRYANNKFCETSCQSCLRSEIVPLYILLITIKLVTMLKEVQLPTAGDMRINGVAGIGHAVVASVHGFAI